jgi:hypothetical protein
MVQNLIVYILIALAVSNVVYQIIKLFRKSRQPGICGGGCGCCNIKHELVRKN